MINDFAWIEDDHYEQIKNKKLLNMKKYDKTQILKIEEGFKYFRDLYSYGVLSQLSDDELMKRIYAWNTKGLIYDCIENDKYKQYGASGIRGTNNIYRIQKGDWYRGDYKIDLDKEKYDDLLSFARGLVASLELIEIAGEIEKIEEYYELEREIREYIGNKIENNWVQKAFHMLYPSLFAEIYDSGGKRNWQKNALCAFQVKPHSKSFIMNGQLALIARAMGYENGYYFAHDIYNTFGWLNHTHVYRLIMEPDYVGEFDYWIKDNVIAMILTTDAFKNIKDNEDRGVMEYNIVVVTCNDIVLGIAHDLRGQYDTNPKYRYRYYRKCKWKYMGTGKEQLPAPTEGSTASFTELYTDENVSYVYKLFYEIANETSYENNTVEEDRSNIHILKKGDRLLVENEIKDDGYEQSIKLDPIEESTEAFQYTGIPKQKVIEQINEKTNIYKRSRTIALNALSHAKYKCEVNPNHPVFKRRNSETNYTESHHLIPMAYSDQFEWSLDTEENIVSLCSNCHNLIHYGEGADKLIEKLYEDREEHLKRAGIEISKADVLKMYGY